MNKKTEYFVRGACVGVGGDYTLLWHPTTLPPCPRRQDSAPPTKFTTSTKSERINTANKNDIRRRRRADARNSERGGFPSSKVEGSTPNASPPAMEGTESYVNLASSPASRLLHVGRLGARLRSWTGRWLQETARRAKRDRAATILCRLVLWVLSIAS